LNNLENEESKIKDLRVKNEGDIFDEREGAMFTINKNLEFGIYYDFSLFI